MWDIDGDKEPRPFAEYTSEPGAALHWLGYSPDGRVLAAADERGGLRVWDSATGRVRWRAPAGEAVVRAPAAFSPDGRLLAVASQPFRSEKGRIHLWEVASGKVRRELTGDIGSVWSLAFSPDGRLLAAGCQDTTILLWGASESLAQPMKGLKAEELDALWADLASDEALVAGRAVARLAAAPHDAAPYLKAHVPAVQARASTKPPSPNSSPHWTPTTSTRGRRRSAIWRTSAASRARTCARPWTAGRRRS